MNENRFRFIWKLLCRVWRYNRHCLERGCGRKTLSYWVRETCKVYYPAYVYRDALMIAVKRGWVVMGKSDCGYTTFKIITPSRDWFDELI